MQVLLLGAGTVTSRLNMQLSEQGHAVVAQIAAFTPQHMDLFDFRALIVISPESSVSPESLVQAAERGKLIFVMAGIGDGLSAWANGVGVRVGYLEQSQLEELTRWVLNPSLEYGNSSIV